MSLPPTIHSPYRSPKEILAAVMAEKNLKPPGIADLIGVTRQQIHAILKGKSAMSEDRVRSLAKTGGLDPDELVAEMRNYALWMKTPEGADHKLRIDQKETQEDFTLKGSRLLHSEEIRLLCDVKLIHITLDAADSSGSLLPTIGAPNKYCLISHLGGTCANDLSENVEESQHFNLLPGKSATVKTLERFTLCSEAVLQFNGIWPALMEQDLDATFELISDFPNAGNLTFRLRNLSDKIVKIDKGDPIASLCVYWNPYAENK